jgi:hypothetical protein
MPAGWLGYRSDALTQLIDSGDQSLVETSPASGNHMWNYDLFMWFGREHLHCAMADGITKIRQFCYKPLYDDRYQM